MVSDTECMNTWDDTVHAEQLQKVLNHDIHPVNINSQAVSPNRHHQRTHFREM